jgi:hypothetical protein
MSTASGPFFFSSFLVHKLTVGDQQRSQHRMGKKKEKEKKRMSIHEHPKLIVLCW